MQFEAPDVLKQPLRVPEKILMGPGPSNPSPRVRAALTLPLLGQMHPETFAIMDDIKEGVRYMFQTQNEVTMCISGAGHSGMEAALCNTLEDGDVILLGVTGIWGERATDMARRYGADVRILQARPGEAISLEDLEAYMEMHKPAVFFITHGDSSTGVLQPLEGMGEMCRKYKCLFIVDTVASLGGTPFQADQLKVDVVYTGSQKVLGAPPGITPISFSKRAMKKIKDRHSKVKVYYWDVFTLGDYWGCFGKPRFYHHSVCTPLLYALREALAQACDQKLGPLIRRHMDCSYRLQCGLEAMGLEMFVAEPQLRLPTVNTIKVPQGVDWVQVAAYALQNYNLEISGGLGPTAGIVFRVGLMGEGATMERVDLVLKVLREALEKASEFKPKPKL